jgi:hypothetical protein
MAFALADTVQMPVNAFDLIGDVNFMMAGKR